MADSYPKEPLAITGMACRLPGGVNNPDEFWNLLYNGVDAISEVPEDRWKHDIFYEKTHGKPVVNDNYSSLFDDNYNSLVRGKGDAIAFIHFIC